MADLQIGRAWLYILLQPNLALAVETLQQAQTLIAQSDGARLAALRQAWVNLYNAQAGLCAAQQDTAGEIEAYTHAVLAARETGDSELLWKALHNVAQTYIHDHQFEPGLLYLAEAQQVAVAVGNQEWTGKCAQTRGAAHFFKVEYAAAIHQYHRAAEMFQRIGNDHWLAAAYADLSEAYVALLDLPQARRYYLEAQLCAHRANTEDVVVQVLSKLVCDYPELALKDLHDRQLKILEIARGNGGMVTRDDLEKLPDFTYTTIRHDLNKLVELGLLMRVGQGRGTKYALPDRAA
jgi:tetratricopeptide (TPR) repeat protein